MIFQTKIRRKFKKYPIEVTCASCEKETFRVKEYMTPHGALLFSCGKEECDTEIANVILKIWGY